MKVTAMLSWFDEPVELLDQAIRSVAAVADALVAVDGAYRLRPNAAPSSPPEQHDAIRHACADEGLELDLLIPDTIWTGQVLKRDTMARRACDQGADWLITMDADYLAIADRAAVRSELAAAYVDVFLIPFHTPIPDGVDPHDVAPNDWHVAQAGTTVPLELVYRALPGLRVESHHWWVSGLRGGVRHGLWGCGGVYPPAPRRPIDAPFVIEHRTLFRSGESVEIRRDWARARELEMIGLTGGVEA